MLRSSTLSRALCAALAIGAIGSPAALAQPNDLGTPHTVGAAAPAQPGQDLRSPDARRPTEAGRTSPPAILRRRSSTHRSATALRGPAPAATRDGGSETPWAMIGIGLAGACLVLFGTVATTARSRRRARVAA
jgi:hypothetical protein